MSQQTALVTAIGSFSADIAIKTLHRMNFEVIGCDIYPAEWVADSANVDRFYQAPYVRDTEEYLAFLKRICLEHAVAWLLPSTDIEVDLLCAKKEEFAECGVTICVSDEPVIRTCRDKLRLPGLLTDQSLVSLIPTQTAEGVDPDALTYPLILKPVDGRSSEGCHVVENAQGLAYFLSIHSGRSMLIQPRIPGRILTADVVCDGKTVACIARRELLRTGNGAGTTVEILENPTLTRFCTETAKKLGIRGAVNFEFIEGEDGSLYFLEINPRFSGGVEFSHIAGYPVVEQHLRCFMGQPILPCGPVRHLTIARKYEEYIMKES